MTEINGSFQDTSAERNENPHYLNLLAHVSTNSSQETVKYYPTNNSTQNQGNASLSLTSQTESSIKLKSTSHIAVETTQNCQYETESQLLEESMAKYGLERFASNSPYMSQQNNSPDESEINEKSSQSSDTIRDVLDNLPEVTDILCLYGKNCKERKTCKYFHYERLCSTPWLCDTHELMNLCDDAHLSDVIKTLIITSKLLFPVCTHIYKTEQFEKAEEPYLQESLNYTILLFDFSQAEISLSRFSSILSQKGQRIQNIEEKKKIITKLLRKWHEIIQTYITNISQLLLEGLDRFKLRLNIILHELKAERQKATNALPHFSGTRGITKLLKSVPVLSEVLRLNKKSEWSIGIPLILYSQLNHCPHFYKIIIVHSCKEFAKLLANFLNSDIPGALFGFDFGDEKQLPPTNLFAFMTIQRLIQVLVRPPALTGSMIIVLHDFEEDDFYFDFAFALLYQEIFSNQIPQRIIKLIVA